FSSRRRHTRSKRDWSSDVCSSDLSYSRADTCHNNYFSFKFWIKVHYSTIFQSSANTSQEVGINCDKAGSSFVLIIKYGLTFSPLRVSLSTTKMYSSEPPQPSVRTAFLPFFNSGNTSSKVIIFPRLSS